MIDTLTFTVPGAAIGKARPRFTRAGGFPRAFTPPETVRRENLIALFYRQAAPDLPPFDGPVTLAIEARYIMPQSWSQKKRNDMRGKGATKRPDFDNLAKIVGDALNKIAWVDDSQIVKARVAKAWADMDGMDVTIHFHRAPVDVGYDADGLPF